MEQKTILMIEDDDFIRELYQRQLEQAGFAMQSTASGKEGVGLLDQNIYDLLMLDLNIPDFSGFQILEHLQKKPIKDMQIMILSNVAQDDYVKKGMEMGAHAFVIKSTYTPAQVVSQVKSLLSV